jgi:hypothetical protein
MNSLVRPRFSLRWLLIALTLFALVLYLFVVHPTVRAHQLIAAINHGDFRGLMELGMLGSLQSHDKNYSFENCNTTAEIASRTWPDVYKCRRNVVVHVRFPAGHATRISGEDYFVTVHITESKWGKDN